MISEIIATTKEHMDKSVKALSNEFMTVRTGRASASVLDRISVDYYGTPTPITQLAGVKSPEAHMLVIEPWDKSILSAVEKAIMASDLGINPSNDGTVIRLPFPAPTEERRKELVKQCRKLTEDARISVRNVRRDANTKLDRAKKDGDVSEDDVKRAEEEVQKLTDATIKHMDELLAHKEAEVMEV